MKKAPDEVLLNCEVGGAKVPRPAHSLSVLSSGSVLHLLRQPRRSAGEQAGAAGLPAQPGGRHGSLSGQLHRGRAGRPQRAAGGSAHARTRRGLTNALNQALERE